MVEKDQIQPEHRPVLLFAFANDERPGRRLGRLCREVEEIRRTLAQIERDGLCEVVIRESTTPAELVEVLNDPRYRRRLTVVHFAGHAGESQLLLEGEHGPVPARIQGLAPLLAELDGLALVFLNGCGTLAQGERLVEAGIPAVVSTDHPVEDEHAQRFAVDFYRLMAAGACVSAAFTRALAQSQCFVCSPGVARDLELATRDEKVAPPWRLLLADPQGDAESWSIPAAAKDPLFGLPPSIGGVLPQEPFMGLRRFTARDSGVFFGRGRAIRNLYGDVTDPALPPLVVVYGASGVGKSSLIEAGLLPRLAAANEVHDLRLERGQDPEALLRNALGDARGHIDLATAWGARERAAGRPVVVCLDQLEVLVLEDGRGKALDRFIRTLESLAGPERPQGKLLLGLRKEWFPELRKELKRRAVEWHEHFVEPLGRDDIEEVVLGPTRSASLRARYGITCEHGLARRIADDLSQDHGSAIAPMLQILLTRMWEHTEPQHTSVDGRVRRRFTQQTYDVLRRDGLALSAFVDRQLEALRASHPQALASGLVLDLLFRHTTSKGTAASCTHGELREAYAHRWQEVESLVERCSSLYLLQACADAQGVDVGVRLAHDTLAPIVHDRYRRSKAPGQAAARLLEARMGMSEAAGRSRLLDEHDLAQVEVAQAGMRQWTEQEERLVVDSRRRRRRTVWLRRWRLGVVVVSVGVAAVAWIVPWIDSLSQADAVDLLHVASSPRASEVRMSQEREPVPNRAGVGDSPQLDTVGTLPTAAGPSGSPACTQRTLSTGITAKAAKIQAMEVTANGERLALGMERQSRAFVLEPHESTSLAELVTHAGVNHLAWHPDGEVLAIGQDKGGVQVVRRDRGGDASIIECTGHESSIKALAFSADGKALTTADELGEVIMWDGWDRDACQVRARASLGAEAYDLRPWASSSWLVVGAGGKLMAWSVTGSVMPVPSSKGTEPIRRVEPLPNGPWVVLAGTRLRLWNPATDELAFNEKHSPSVQWVVALDAGQSVLAVSKRTVELWQRSGNALELAEVPLEIPGIEDVAVTRDGGDIFVADSFGSVHWLRRGAGLKELRSLAISSEKLSTIVVEPSLRYFAVGDHGGRVALVTFPTDRGAARECLVDVVQ